MEAEAAAALKCYQRAASRNPSSEMEADEDGCEAAAALKCYQRALAGDPFATCSTDKETSPLQLSVCTQSSDKSRTAYWAFRRLVVFGAMKQPVHCAPHCPESHNLLSGIDHPNSDLLRNLLFEAGTSRLQVGDHMGCVQYPVCASNLKLSDCHVSLVVAWASAGKINAQQGTEGDVPSDANESGAGGNESGAGGNESGAGGNESAIGGSSGLSGDELIEPEPPTSDESSGSTDDEPPMFEPELPPVVEPVPVGLVNILGCSCYYNALLQLLVALESVRSFIAQMVGNPWNRVQVCLRRVILHHEDTACRGHEKLFYTFLYDEDLVDEEGKRKFSAEDTFAGYSVDVLVEILERLMNSSEAEGEWVYETFETHEAWSCMNCRRRTIFFRGWGTSLCSDWPPRTLDELLSLIATRYCITCNVVTEWRMRYRRLPTTLIFYNDSQLRIMIPQLFDVRNHTEFIPAGESTLYQLKAIIMHTEQEPYSLGHLYALVKWGRQWFMVNDEDVQALEWDGVARMVFGGVHVEGSMYDYPVMIAYERV